MPDMQAVQAVSDGPRGPGGPHNPHARPIAYPGNVIIDAAGSLWIADSGHHRVLGARPGGEVHTVIGRSADQNIGQGVGHSAAQRNVTLAVADLHSPQGLVLSAAGDVLYIADPGAHAVHRADLATGAVTVIAGSPGGAGLAGTGAPGRTARAPDSLPWPALEVPLCSPWALALDEQAGLLYVAMAGAHQIWVVDLHGGHAAVFAGTGSRGLTGGLIDGPRAHAAFARPSGLALSPDRRRLYVTDSETSAIRLILMDSGEVSTLIRASQLELGAGDNTGTGGTHAHVRTQHNMDVAVTPFGLIVTDTHALRGINIRHLTVTTVWRGNGPDPLDHPGGVDYDRTNRTYIVSDTNNHRLMRIAPHTGSATEIILS